MPAPRVLGDRRVVCSKRPNGQLLAVTLLQVRTCRHGGPVKGARDLRELFLRIACECLKIRSLIFFKDEQTIRVDVSSEKIRSRPGSTGESSRHRQPRGKRGAEARGRRRHVVCRGGRGVWRPRTQGTHPSRGGERKALTRADSDAPRGAGRQHQHIPRGAAAERRPEPATPWRPGAGGGTRAQPRTGILGLMAGAGGGSMPRPWRRWPKSVNYQTRAESR